ncbi:MAG: thioredoxin family protein [Candidatus Bipolaricaulia bacterium]
MEARSLQEYFEGGLTSESFATLLTEEQKKLHSLHDRRAEIDDEAVAAVRSAGDLRVLVITEPWCGDSLAIFPVVSALFGRAGSEVRVVRRDEHLELIDRYLTRGGRAIPIVLVLDEAYGVKFRWGPRPSPAQQIVDDHREDVKAGRTEKTEVHKKVRSFYGRDKGKTIVDELVAALRA